MPIHLPFPIRNLCKSEFDELDRTVMRCAYDSQNELRRLCDERVYENDLALRLQAAGLAGVYTQVPVRLEHDGFSKVYRLDLVVEDGLYELKTVAEFTTRHDAQILNYDWGGYLESNLYEEAIVHFTGGETACVHRTRVVHRGVKLGTHLINEHANGIAFVVTAFQDIQSQRPHFAKLRELTSREAIQWINMSNGTIHLETITA